MTDATTEFFEGLARRRHEPLLEGASGTLRLDLVNGDKTERWLVAVDKGDVTVSHRNTRADCTLRTPKSLFERMATGEVNATAAFLRGELAAEGDWELLVLFQRLLPSPPASRERKRANADRRRRR
ncbi:MAG TPA: SCP2 sterol-binding domain-containing protein [Gaiellaceae bacterium]|nr:SCP2 sterol-binding domain-containing protein [Gaiellaceae bacterium]